MGISMRDFIHRTLLTVSLSALVTAIPGLSNAQEIPSFPGAEGFGSTTPGGRGGAVLVLTNLQDSGPGSFRDACERKVPRIIVFATGGTISLNSDVTIKHPFCTVAGQTAPGGGICIRNFAVNIYTHDVVIRFLRFRMGVRYVGESQPFQDCVRVCTKPAPYNVVLDHCSISWGVSRNIITWDGVRDMTVQWTIMSEAPRDEETDQKGLDGMNFLIGDYTKNISVHHCLFAHAYQRNPRLKHGVRAHLVNNVVYNWSDGAATLCGDFQRSPQAPPVEANIINCWFKAGANTPTEVPIIKPLTSVRLYRSGNVTDRPWFPEESAEQSVPVTLLEQPISAPPVTIWSATEAFERVLAEAGAILPVRDAADRRVVAEVRTGTGHFIKYEDEIGGFPLLAPGRPPEDSDSDGMPDTWEQEHGLDPTDPSDAAGDRDRDGYINIEEWMNDLASREPSP